MSSAVARSQDECLGFPPKIFRGTLVNQRWLYALRCMRIFDIIIVLVKQIAKSLFV